MIEKNNDPIPEFLHVCYQIAHLYVTIKMRFSNSLVNISYKSCDCGMHKFRLYFVSTVINLYSIMHDNLIKVIFLSIKEEFSNQCNNDDHVNQYDQEYLYNTCAI